MAGVAGGRQTLELSHRRALVAGVAIYGGVRPDQREAVEVLIDLLNGDIPALHGMALLAVRTHLALVEVGVAVRAFFPHVGKHRLHVALCASHTFMHSAQRILRCVVIEFRNRADRLPTA